MSQNKPNVIFILVDDLGWGELGCYGNTFNETPNIDALAAGGIRFTTAYASSTVCSPSRAALMTGQAPPRNGITDYLRPDTEWHLPLNPNSFADNELPEDTDFRFDPNMVTLADMFKQQSYHTGIIGKWHLSGYDQNGVKFGPTKYGFNESIVSEQVGIGNGSYFWPYKLVDPAIQPLDGKKEEYLVDRMNEEAVRFIRRNADRPFFLYLSHYAVHTTLVGKTEDVRYFAEKAGLNSSDDLAWIKHHNPILAAMLKSVDDGVGMIRKTLEELGLDQNTLIIFTSDNGGETRVTRNGHLRGGKSTTYEGGLRIPLAMSWPQRVAKGTECRVPTINMDFYPTFAEILGYQIPKHHIVDGVSITSLMYGLEEGAEIPADLVDRSFYWHYPLEKPHFLGGRSSAANRTGDWKIISFFDDESKELYNLSNDEAESVNLSRSEPELTHKLDENLKSWLESVNAEIPATRKQ
ncbi:sulfatase [Paenibacillus allorhizosphaerae]|nr:sulfatase [Paenibacillus allorhizosphaerae]